MYYKALVLLIFSIIMCSCSPKISDTGVVNNKPGWYWNPNDGVLLGGVGEARTHIDGVSAQRRLATTRAIEDIARQKGVNVSQVQTIAQHADSNGGSTSTSIESYSVHTVEGTTISARVREVWQDPTTGYIVVWVTEY